MKENISIILASLSGVLAIAILVVLSQLDIKRADEIEVETIIHPEPIAVAYSVRVSCYSATKEQCGNDNGITYTGAKVFEGGCAISPDLLMNSRIMFGDTIEIIGTPRDGMYIVNDLTAKHIKNTIDIYMADTKQGGFCERGIAKLIIKPNL